MLSTSTCYFRKANRNDLKQAVADFRQALLLNSKHRNGRKYLVETLVNMAQRYVQKISFLLGPLPMHQKIN